MLPKSVLQIFSNGGKYAPGGTDEHVGLVPVRPGHFSSTELVMSLYL